MIIFISVISIVVALVLGVLVYMMFKRKCELQRCFKCKSKKGRKTVEKEEENQDYGEYYFTDGRRMATEMEVRF